MESPQLHAIGFDAPTLDELIRKAFDAGVRGINTAPGFSLIGAYTDPSGARLSFLQREGESASTTAALVAHTAYRAQVVRFTDLLARVALYSPDAEGTLLTQFLAMVDDPVAYPLHDLTQDGEFTVIERLQVAALAIDVHVFDDADAFLASPESTVGTLKLDPHALMSPGLLGLKAAAISKEEASPTMLMAMTVDEVEVRRNELTGVDFQYVTGTSACRLAAGIPMDHPVAVGNVVWGTWFGTCSSGLWDGKS